MNPVISVNNLTKTYGNITAVRNLSIAVGHGEVFGLLGENGAGKSTTIECMLGIRKPDSGTVCILNQDPVTARKQLFEEISVQLQEGHYQDKITVAELCEETACLYQTVTPWQTLLEQFHLTDKEKTPVQNLSGGQKQRLFLVLALIPNPKVIFLDELTTGLDVKARREVWQYLIQQKNEGLTIFLTSHFMDEVEILCDRIGILADGNMIYSGTVAAAIADSPCDTLEEAYLWYIEKEVTN